nr:caspase family protein [Methylomarinum sp. Ch1-1]MDP4519994.1 caspase family protein [Methylomarinum sp. Ch1-1]
MFQTIVAVNDDLNPVKIVATYKKGEPRVLNFNLLAKTSTDSVIDQAPPVKAVAKIYPSVDFGRFYALVIGNRDYRQLPSLNTSVEDAKAVDEVLRNRYGYKTTLLINANRHQIMTALNDLRKVLTEKDNLLIYYAGHGEIDKTDQSAYWLPTDAEPDNSANWLSSHSITQFLNIISAKHILVVADSCYSGAMTQSAIARLPGQMAEEKRKKWLKFMVKRKARTVMTSGGVKPVLDSGGGRHSVFAKAFLNVLRTNGGLLEDYELFRSVSSQVQESAALVGFQQSPQYSAMLHAGHEGSPFFFVPRVN